MNQVIAAQITILRKLKRELPQPRKEIKDMADGAWNGCIEMVQEIIKNKLKILKKQL